MIVTNANETIKGILEEYTEGIFRTSLEFVYT